MTLKAPTLFRNCILWYTGELSTSDAFPIIPAGVTVTPAGTFENPLDLGNNKSIVTFNGSTNYLSLADNDAWDFVNSNFSGSFWIRLGSISQSADFLYQFQESSYYYLFYWNHAYNRLAITCHEGDTYRFSYYCEPSFSTNTWYHIVIMRYNDTCIMYINGISKTITTLTAFNDSVALAGSFVIGHEAYYLNGNIKDLMIFNRTLTEAEIVEIMIHTNPASGEGVIPGPYDYWRIG